MCWNGGVNEVSAAGRAEASILHVDMDSFFVSVELLDRPELQGAAVVVAQATGRSVVSSASYEARRFGVHSAQPLTQALARCPHLVVIPPEFTKYRAASRAVMQIFRSFTPLVEPLSIDEAFLDVAGARRLFGAPRQIADDLRVRVREETGLPCSVGLAASKHVAKLASQRAKPDGVLEVPPEHTLQFLHPLPVEAIWGVGAATAKTLHGRAIHTVRDLALEPLPSLVRMVGEANAWRLHELANGRDAREVSTERVEKSISHEETFAVDVRDHGVLERELLRLATKVGERLREKSLEARTIGLKLRYENFETMSRSRTLAEPTAAGQRIARTARELLDGLDSHRAVRLIGVRAEQLVAAGSLPAGLWADDEQWNAVDRAIDSVRERFGAGGLTSASLLRPRDTVVDARSLEPPT